MLTQRRTTLRLRAVAALNEAFAKVATQLVLWAARVI